MSNADTKQNSKSKVSDQAREMAGRTAASAGEMAGDAARYYLQEPAKDLLSLFRDYAKEKPDVAACWAFGLGVLVGWKLKP